MEPIIVFWRSDVPNSVTVLIILQELGRRYQATPVELEDLEDEFFKDIELHHRLPAISDPNTNTKVFGSGAIVHYLIKTYDKSNTLAYDSSSPEEAKEVRSRFSFQSMGRGPFAGFAAWVHTHGSEPLPLAEERYVKEIKELASWLNSILADGRPWLVEGPKCTYADLAFVMWNNQITRLLNQVEEPWEKYPFFQRWYEALLARDSVKHVLAMARELYEQSSRRA